MTSGWQGAPYFRRFGRGLFSQPAVLFNKSWGGCRRTTRVCILVYLGRRNGRTFSILLTIRYTFVFLLCIGFLSFLFVCFPWFSSSSGDVCEPSCRGGSCFGADRVGTPLASFSFSRSCLRSSASPSTRKSLSAAAASSGTIFRHVTARSSRAGGAAEDIEEKGGGAGGGKR